MIDIQSYENYFNNIVAIYGLLNGFYAVDMFEFDSFLNDLKGGEVPCPALALEYYEEDTSAVNSQNLHDNVSGAIIILDKFDIKYKTPDEKTAFLKKVYDIIKQVKKRMIEDSYEDCNIMFGLDYNSISIKKTDLLAGDYMGYRMEFTIINPDETEFDDNWL